jgi:alkaline phosphatase D
MTLSNRFFLACLSGLILSFSYPCMAQNDGKRPMNELFRALSLEDNLYILNMWGEQPAHKRELYKLAFSILEQKPNSTYADVARHSGFQELCNKYGVVHLGGPMLGDIVPGGAKVWVRTVRPANVEVRLESEGRELVFGPVRCQDSCGNLFPPVGIG